MKLFVALAKKQKILLLTFFLLFATFSNAFSQNNETSGDAGDDPDIPKIPLDGGLSLLLVAGAAYGGKKVHEYRNRKAQNLKDEDVA